MEQVGKLMHQVESHDSLRLRQANSIQSGLNISWRVYLPINICSRILTAFHRISLD